MALAKLDLRDMFFDLEGRLAAGGKVYTYAGSTTTQLATYSDAEGTANTNPVILNSSGECHLWYTKGLAYKVIVTDLNDVPLYPENNVFIPDEADSFEGSLAVDFQYAGNSSPTSLQWLGGYSFPVAVTFPVNWAGAFGNINIRPTADFQLDLRRNATAANLGESVGTVTINTSGNYTFASADSAEVLFEIGDHLSAWAPEDRDDTATNFNFTLLGEVAQ